MIKRNPEVATQPLLLGRMLINLEFRMKKVACVIYPNFSLYEIVDLTSSLVLQYGIKVDYISSNKESVIS